MDRIKRRSSTYTVADGKGSVLDTRPVAVVIKTAPERNKALTIEQEESQR